MVSANNLISIFGTSLIFLGSSSGAWYENDAAPYADPYITEGLPAYKDTTSDAGARKEFDYIIVGAGTAGCVVARRLSDAGHSVLVLDQGEDWQQTEDWWKATRAPRNSREPHDASPLLQRFDSESNPALFGRQVPVVLGATLGGTSSINNGYYWRPEDRDFDMHWGEGWSSAEVASFFSAAEEQMKLQNGSGETLGGAWMAAANAAGVPSLPGSALTMQGNASGIFLPKTVFVNSRRMDAFKAYLRPIMPRKGLEVRTRASIAKLIIVQDSDVKRAIGAVYMLAGQRRVSVYAKREVILAAGWLGSPKVLMMSGIGPAASLRSVGVTSIIDVPGQGEVEA
eukprot:jgi/Bigna1/136356/aug1.33_g11064